MLVVCLALSIPVYAMAGTIKFSFLCGARGYHEYRFTWTPVLDEVLPARCEEDNTHDIYAIAVMKCLSGTLVNTVVGHLPREISRFTHFIIVHGARVSCKVTEVHYRRSPLIQGGLEIPIEVTVEMPVSEANILAIERYKALVGQHYEEPVNGNYPDATAAILKAMKSESDYEDNSEDSENLD